MEDKSLRKEASKNAWKQLYDITLKLDKLEPWNYLGDTQLVTIQLKDREEPVFCSVMGKFSGERGIAVFDGVEGLGDFYMILGSEEGDLPAQYLMDEHSSLTCFWGSMMNVPDEQRKVIDELDIRFKTISDWIYFVSYKKGYKPYQLDEDEVALLIETYENLYMVVEAVRQGELNPEIEQAEGIVRRYNTENDTWEMFVKEIPEAEKEFQTQHYCLHSLYGRGCAVRPYSADSGGAVPYHRHPGGYCQGLHSDALGGTLGQDAPAAHRSARHKGRKDGVCLR